MHILIIEDDERIAGNIKILLKASGYQTTVSENGEDGLFQAEEENFDAIVMDWMLPDISGVDICKKLRQKNNPVPILMLTAKSQLDDKIKGLSYGADDYLTKPFAKEELIVRIKALIRRATSTNGSPSIKIADLEINTNTTEVKLAGKIVNLAPREYSLLEYLVLHQNKVIDRMTLLHNVWGEDIDPFSNTVDVHIRYLRQKIDVNRKKPLIKTIKNKGYMLCSD
ncbi:response regulator transcription factor [Patescibacteria group bacterium]|nr:response regulator transcription factor [Patescibacteria group bacterium]